MKNNISGVLLTKNNADIIPDIYKSLKSFGEIIVVDDYSTDNTEYLCKKYGITYYKRSLNNDFAAQRNFALEKVKNDWVLYLDTDETIGKKFVDEVVKRTEYDRFNGYYIKRNVIFLGYQMKGTEMGDDVILRLGKRNAGKWIRKVHEYWKIKGRIGCLTNPIVHNTADNLSDFLEKLNRYTPVHAEENMRSGKTPSFIKIILFTPAKFLLNYFLKRGYKDNDFGFVVSIFMSFHTFLSWSSAWLQKRGNRNSLNP